MNPLLLTILPFFREESGPTSIEYAVLLSLIIIACMSGILAFGNSVNQYIVALGNRFVSELGL